MKNLEKIYRKWIMFQEDVKADTDCGLKEVREDFSNFAGLETEISFKEMLELEQNYIEEDGFTKGFKNQITL